MDEFNSYANGLIMSGFMQEGVKFFHFTGISANKVTSVYEILVAEGVFNPLHIYQDVDWWFRMQIPHTYYRTFEAKAIASHLHCFMAAKKLSQAMGRDEEALFAKKQTPEGTIFLCTATYADSVRVEREIEEYIENEVPDGHSVSIRYVCSGRPFIPNGKHLLSLYVVEVAPYVMPIAPPDEDDIWKIASSSFLTEKTYNIRTRYQTIIKEFSGKLAPIVNVHPMQDGIIPVAVALRHSQKTSFLLRFTEVLRTLHLNCGRKFVETFSNGVVVYSFYLVTTNQDLIQKCIHQMLMISLVPSRSLRNLFLDGKLSVEEFAYVSSVKKFIYYFVNQTDDDAQALMKVLSNDPHNLGRLVHMRSNMRREAISDSRISTCVIDNVEISKKLFADFVRCTNQSPSYNFALEKEIQRQSVGDVLDQSILRFFLMFNSQLCKTNFWKSSKASLAFSFRPTFLKDVGYPENPYMLFFVLGTEFQGFHIRFRDIARGGIRVIRSLDKTIYEKNMEGQFTENYDLAYTQNMKNKDIPEFGSKGTVLLNSEAQGTIRVSFQKYVAGLLDLLVLRKDSNVIDHYGRQELLFLGPDENTADLMEWAALYAKTRGYPYWVAFTTGKPPSLGGVPHDKYGMTTRSVRRVVLGCLQKCGLKEENVTKAQTGGPDGDLGSNEILIAKDKTVTIIDGSGVAYDPAGLNRDELIRLARGRLMLEHFDTTKLGPGGFRVLCTDSNVTLPSGEVVENGLIFRNQFHLHPLFTADLFVPCGGRPQSINLRNVNKLFKEDGTPKFKIIVEGANLFLTPEARICLEEGGVILYKDASSNKGGVTSSSLEVLAAIAMTEEEHTQHMRVTDPNNPPQFYQKYVEEIQMKIELNAALEFEAIWRENQRTKLPRSVLSNAISKKINALNDSIESSSLYENMELRLNIMRKAIPQTLQNFRPLEEIICRLPVNYARAIFNSYLSSTFIYQYGLEPNDFAFFEFIESLNKKVEHQE
eukprot:TRINITY_DN8557_c0_g2_i3.p1 TRINITY_DN8557_c0_g2~~TRINITY_DN8557_c0_g2_i3.p1  ORF type:complete len:986 (+),score=217.93 TRINITY_DN8557_c0_g2_i3:378-3335(+)